MDRWKVEIEGNDPHVVSDWLSKWGKNGGRVTSIRVDSYWRNIFLKIKTNGYNYDKLISFNLRFSGCFDKKDSFRIVHMKRILSWQQLFTRENTFILSTFSLESRLLQYNIFTEIKILWNDYLTETSRNWHCHTMSFSLQLKLLVWKNYTLRKRQWVRFVLS